MQHPWQANERADGLVASARGEAPPGFLKRNHVAEIVSHEDLQWHQPHPGAAYGSPPSPEPLKRISRAFSSFPTDLFLGVRLLQSGNF